MDLESTEGLRVLQQEWWLEAWPWAKTVAMGLEGKVRQFKSDAWTRAQAEVKAQLLVRIQAWGQKLQELQAREREAQAREARVRGPLAWWVEAQVQEAQVQEAQARAQVQAQVLVQARVQVQAQAQAQARALAWAQAHASVRVKALALAGTWGWAEAEARERGEHVPSAVADSGTSYPPSIIMGSHIIYGTTRQKGEMNIRASSILLHPSPAFHSNYSDISSSSSSTKLVARQRC